MHHPVTQSECECVEIWQNEGIDMVIRKTLVKCNSIEIHSE